ncbi:MAG TPA: M23 family metallopeptidase [Cyclobacteriaceae bacterium]|nr:M23 family metallopeptidase [Cyclobacteriaceae bacterium]
MKPKKTLSNWLTSRYQLIIRNEENFAEKTSLGFTYSKVILFSVIIFSILFVTSLFLSRTLLAKWFDPRHAQIEMNKQLVELKEQFDSLSVEVDRKDQFILNFQRVLSGDTSNFKDPAQIMQGNKPLVKTTAEVKLAPADSQFRKEFEKSDLSLITLTSGKYRELQETFFFSPITGFISDHFDVKKGHYGVDIVAKTNEAVKNVADGTILFASWTQDSGYVIMVQHRGNLISVYKHNAELLKKVGTFVNAGEIISIVGNSGEMTDGPHLHFELWYNGNPLNPEEFVTF